MATIACGVWKSQLDLPVAKSNGLLVSFANNLFYIGGSSDALTSGTQEVYRAPVKADGVVGSWSTVGVVPKLMAFFGGVVEGSTLFLAGGNTTAPVDSMYTSKLSADGSMTNMVYSRNMWTSFRNPCVVAVGNYVYTMGGQTTALGLEVFSGKFLDAASGVATWVPQTALPQTLNGHAAVDFGGYIYVIGGSTNALAGGARAEIYSAKVEPNGGLGPWVTCGFLPVALHKMTACVFRNKLIVLGGQDAAGTNVATMYVGKLEHGGGLGPLVVDDLAIPIAHRNASVAVVGHRIYLASGFTTVRIARVDMLEVG